MFTKFRYLTIALLTLFAIIAILLIVSKRSHIAKDKIIARVGDEIITVDEFRYSYEFGPAPLKHGPNPRRTYLDYMIREKLLAEEGYAKGYHKSSYVTRRMRHRRYLDLLEAFYTKYVHGRVKIPEDSIKEAVKKSTVTFRLRIWPTKDLDDAEKAYLQAKNIGLADYIKKQLAKADMPIARERNFVTGWIDYLEIRPEILNGIKDLEVGTVSKPIPFENGYALFEVVDIQRSGIREQDLERGVKRKRIEDRLHNIEADKIVHNLMDSLLTPMNVRVKGRVVAQLAPALYEWINKGLPFGPPLLDTFKNPDTLKGYLKSINDLLDETLVTYDGKKKTVRDYLRYMDYFRKELKRRPNEEEFEKVLVTEIGRMIKNDTFVEIAARDGFEKSEKIQQDLRLWQDKWTYEAFRNDLVSDIAVSDSELVDYFKHHWRELPVADVDSTRFESYRIEVYNEVKHKKYLARLEEEVAQIKEQYPVWINEAVLDTLNLHDEGLSRNISLLVINRFSRKPVVPTVDLNWIAF